MEGVLLSWDLSHKIVKVNVVGWSQFSHLQIFSHNDAERNELESNELLGYFFVVRINVKVFYVRPIHVIVFFNCVPCLVYCISKAV